MISPNHRPYSRHDHWRRGIPEFQGIQSHGPRCACVKSQVPILKFSIGDSKFPCHSLEDPFEMR